MKELIKKESFSVSLEVFPPKKEEEFPGAFELLNKLTLLNPDFISVTYGAGGSRSKKTVDIASYIHNTLHIPALAHLTCVGNTKTDIDAVVADLKAAGIKNVLALRGDRPSYMTDEQFDIFILFHHLLGRYEAGSGMEVQLSDFLFQGHTSHQIIDKTVHLGLRGAGYAE